MVNYNNGKIYKIVCNITGKCYIGSTCETTLARRLANHRRTYKQFLNGKYNYITSFEIIKNDNYDIILLEKCENINTKDQLHARERFYIETIECVNKYIPTRTDKEYYLDNKEKISEYHKDYYDVNKDRILEHKKDYYDVNKDRILEQRKQNYDVNKDRILEQQKKYQIANAEKISLQKKNII